MCFNLKASFWNIIFLLDILKVADTLFHFNFDKLSKNRFIYLIIIDVLLRHYFNIFTGYISFHFVKRGFSNISLSCLLSLSLCKYF